VQDQVLRLLARLQADLGVGFVLVSHDLGVVAQVAHEVAVVRHGRVLEQGPAGRVLNEPAHEYTRTLLDAVPGRSLREAAA
jgi:peptide/nickel transport system ATP-binding protein